MYIANEDERNQYITHMMTYDLFKCLSERQILDYPKNISARELLKMEMADEVFGEKNTPYGCAYCQYVAMHKGLDLDAHNCTAHCPGITIWQTPKATRVGDLPYWQVPCYDFDSPYHLMRHSNTVEGFRHYARHIAAQALVLGENVKKKLALGIAAGAWQLAQDMLEKLEERSKNMKREPQTNIDPATGIRYGVLPSRLAELWPDMAVEVWSDPTCPRCGKLLNDAREDFDYDAECGTYTCDEEGEVFYPMEINDDACPNCNSHVTQHTRKFWQLEGSVGDYHCAACGLLVENVYAQVPVDYEYRTEKYEAVQDVEGTDIFVIKSPYYTFCGFCSPCAPGAGDLTAVRSSRFGVMAYCLGHEFFAKGAPYPVYLVENNKRLLFNAKEESNGR